MIHIKMVKANTFTRLIAITHIYNVESRSIYRQTKIIFGCSKLHTYQQSFRTPAPN